MNVSLLKELKIQRGRFDYKHLANGAKTGPVATPTRRGSDTPVILSIFNLHFSIFNFQFSLSS